MNKKKQPPLVADLGDRFATARAVEGIDARRTPGLGDTSTKSSDALAASTNLDLKDLLVMELGSAADAELVVVLRAELAAWLHEFPLKELELYQVY